MLTVRRGCSPSEREITGFTLGQNFGTAMLETRVADVGDTTGALKLVSGIGPYQAL